MTLKIGVIADDFTGATDIASFLVLNGLKTVQMCGITPDLPAPDAEAVVISHKSRSCPVQEAIDQTQASLQWLLQHGCQQVYFKYCSTFDSSAQGNIGPVADALMESLGENFTIFSPALPVNGRTVYKGYLFVGDVLLEESGMRHHPITPMTDSSLVRLVEMQSKGKCGVVTLETVRQGAAAVKAKLAELKAAGYSYAVIDAVDESDLVVQGEALQDMRLVTGGSGLAIGLARQVAAPGSDSQQAQSLGYPQGKHAVVFSGSCSVMTNKQVAFYQEHADDHNAPLIYATANPDELAAIQQKYGVEASSHAVENFFAQLSTELYAAGVRRFIIAGGETSSIVTKSLQVDGFYIGPAIAPGVPWVRSINNDISLTLKSGNFGQEDFFLKAQRDFPV